MMQEEAKDESSRSKGIFSDNYVNLGGGTSTGTGTGTGTGASPFAPHGYPAQHGASYPYPLHGYPPPPPPPLPAYPAFGHPQHVYYTSPPHDHVPAPAYSTYPYSTPYGYAPHYGHGKHQQHHLDYYHHQEVNMYHHGYAHNNHGYGKHHLGMRREVSDAKF